MTKKQIKKGDPAQEFNNSADFKIDEASWKNNPEILDAIKAAYNEISEHGKAQGITFPPDVTAAVRELKAMDLGPILKK